MEHRSPTNNLNPLFASTVILRLACDCCWQVGEQRKTGNELNHLLTLKITNWKVLGPGVNSTWLLQMREWEFSKEKAYLKEFSKIWFWCHGKTLNSNKCCWLLEVSSRRHMLAKNYNMNTVVQNPGTIMPWRFWQWKRKNKKGKEVLLFTYHMPGPVIKCLHKHHVIYLLQHSCELELPIYKWRKNRGLGWLNSTTEVTQYWDCVPETRMPALPSNGKAALTKSTLSNEEIYIREGKLWEKMQL